MSFLEEWAASLPGNASQPSNSQAQGTPAVSSHGVRMAFEDASGLTAQNAARASELANALNMPENVVLENPDLAEREENARRVEQNPRLAAFAGQSRTNAAFVRNDAGLQRVFTAVQENQPSFLDSWADELQHGSIRQYRPGFWESMGILLGEGGDQIRESIAGSVLMVAENIGAEKYAKTLRAILTEHKKNKAAPLQAESDFGNYAYDVVRMVPQIASQAGVAVATGGLGTVASVTASAGFMGTQIAGGKYLKLTEQGVDPERALYASLADAGLQTPLEKIGLSKFVGIFRASGLGKIIKTAGQAAATEFLTEWAQKYPEAITQIWGEAKVKGRSAEESVAYFLDHFGEITREGIYEGAVAAPFGFVGQIKKIAADVQNARAANTYAQQHLDLHVRVEETSTKQLSPSHMQSALEAAGPAMLEQVQLPADAALELYQGGTDILSPLGITEQEAVTAAGQGQAFTVPVSRMHAYLDQQQFEAAAHIMRRTPDGMNAAEAARLDEEVAANARKVIELYHEQAAELDQLTAQKENLRKVATERIDALPGLKATLESRNGGVARYVNDWLGMVERYSLRMAAAGANPAEMFRKLSVRSLGQAQNNAGELQQAAMIRAEDATVADFAKRIAAVGEEKKSYFEMRPDQGVFSGVSVRLPADTIRHKNRRHPDMTDADMETLPRVLSALTSEQTGYPQKQMPRYGGEPVFGWAVVDGQAYGIVLETVAAGRTLVTTYFKDDAAGIRNWFEQNTQKEKAATTPAPLRLGQASNEDVLRNQPSSDPNIVSDDNGVNPDILFQPALFQGEEKRAKFTESPVAKVSGTEIFSFSEPVNIAEARKSALDWARENGVYREDYVNLDTGWTDIALREKGLESSLRHRGGPEKIQSVAALPQLIRNGVFLETTPAHNTKQKGMKSHIFAAKADIAGKPVVVGFVIKEDANGKRFYDHELTEMKDLDGLVSHSGAIGLDTEKAFRTRQGSVLDIVRKHLGVNPDILFQPGGLYGGFPVLFQEELSAEEALRRDAEAWGKSVDAFIANNLPTDKPVIMLQQTPLVLQMLGAENRTLQTTFSVLEKAFKKHGLSADTIKQVPAAMADPVMIFRSATVGGDYVMMLGIKDEHGATVVVPVSLEYESFSGDTVNQVPSIYVKSFETTRQPNNNWFARQIEQGNLVYRHNKKSRDWFRTAGLQLPGNPKYRGMDTLYTDADLVKLRAENTGMYQGDPDVVGSVTPEMAREIGLPHSGEFIARESDLAPIDKKHGKQFKDTGFANAREFISYVLSGIDAVYALDGGAFSFVRRGETKSGQVIAELEVTLDNGVYRVTTAHPVRNDFFKNKAPLWERAQSDHSENGTPGAVSGQSEAPFNFTTVNQGVKSGARGSLRRQGDGWMISLFRNADPSTLLHETAHVFFEEMGAAVNSGIADAGMIADYEALKAWFSRFDDEANLNAEYDTSVKGHPLFEGRAFEELSAEEKVTARTIAEKEYFARGFEAYLLEGKAPSEGMEGMFSRFRKWLLAVYRDIRTLNVELNDDVRGVFGRMISMEQEVANAAARNELIDLTRSELDALGITGPAREYAGKLMTAARDAATRNLEADRNRDRKRRLGQYAREAREELMKLPLYAARSDIRRTPLDAASVREFYGEDTAKALRKSLPFGLKDEGGVDPEIFASEHGFASGTDMVAQIIDSPSLKQAIEQRVQEKEAEHDAAFPPAGYLIETAQANEQVAMVGQYLAQNLGRQHVPQEAFASAAEQELAAMPMGRAMQTGTFLAAMRRFLRQERLAIGRGDFAAALEANHKARLNMEFAKRSREVARAQGATQRLVERFIGMSKADPDARYIVMDVGMRHGLNTYQERLGEGRDVRTIQEWLGNAEADGYTVYADDAILYGAGKPWREMTLTEFENLSEVVNQIVTVERNQRQLLTAQGEADLDTVAGSIAESIYGHRTPKAAKTVEKQPAAVKALKGFHAIHMKVEAMCIALDGDKRGPTWEAVYLPIASADDAQSMRFKEITKALRGGNLFGAYTRKELAEMGSRKDLVQEVGENLTWENRIALALNMGNEINVSRIKDGHKWNDDQIAAVLRPLTRKDWEFVQNVWDYIDTFKDEAFALQEEISGMRPKPVEAQQFTVQAADGATIRMRGGYYPIKYNSDKGFRAFMQEQKAMDKELFGGRNYGAAMTKNGHLKERAGGGMGSPLLLELSVITDHLFNVVHDITYRKAVLDAAKVIKHKTVREAIEGTVSQQIYRELMPWLQDVANERQEPMHAVHRWARWARAGSSIMAMGYKFTTMFAQPLGFTQSIEVLGAKWAAAGVKRVYRNPLMMPELLEETFARSSFMANRIKSFDREVRDITKQLKPGMGRFAWVDTVKENAFVPMGVFQMGVDLPTWWGAFERGMQELQGNEARAEQYADSVVRMSQGSGSTKDLARVQRGGDLLRLTTMFYSYFNTLYNLGARGVTALKEDQTPAGIFRAANTALLLWFVPSVLSELFAGRGPDDEGRDAWAAMNILQYPFQAVIGVRDITNHVFGGYGGRIDPAQAAPKAIGNWFKSVSKALEEEDAGKLVKPTAEAAGYLFGLPMKQPIITVGNLWDYLTGEDPEVYARDLFFVKPKDRR